MKYSKYDTICCKHCFYFMIFNELSCIDQGNQLLMITNTIQQISMYYYKNIKQKKRIFRNVIVIKLTKKAKQNILY